MSRMEFQLVPREDLDAQRKDCMFRLLRSHFEGVTADVFARDLAEKNLVLLLERGGELVGFSTLAAYTTCFDGLPVNVIYSGDTIVSPEAWGTASLPRAWVAGVEALRETLPTGRCFWMLLSSGFRTYRFLPVFWRNFFPRFDAPTPAKMGGLMKKLARERFGLQFDAEAGVVRFDSPQRLRAEISKIPDGREKDPHTAFFLSQNPGHARGDELICLTEICPENLTAAGRRMMKSRIHELASHDC
jgi:hypothetical protein